MLLKHDSKTVGDETTVEVGLVGVETVEVLEAVPVEVLDTGAEDRVGGLADEQA